MPKRKAKKETKGAADFASFMAQMNKDDAIINLGEREEKFYKFGDYNLDRALGGGLPAGQIYAFQGPPASGKSLAALTISQQVINDGGRVAYSDTEAKISPKALSMMGLKNNEGFLHLTIENLEDTIEKLTEFADSGFFDMLVVDSLDSLTTDEQEERDIHDGSKVGGYKAKVLSEWLPSVVHRASANECSILFVQQIRKDPSAYGSGETTSCGEAIKHNVTTRLRFGPNKAGDAVEGGKLVYQGANVRVLKTNQGAVPKDPIPVRFYIGDAREWGIDKINSTLDEAIRLGIMAPKSATSHVYIPCADLCTALDADEKELTFNGKNNLLAAVSTDDAFFNAIHDLVDEYEKNNPLEIEMLDEDEISVDFEELDE